MSLSKEEDKNMNIQFKNFLIMLFDMVTTEDVETFKASRESLENIFYELEVMEKIFRERAKLIEINKI